MNVNKTDTKLTDLLRDELAKTKEAEEKKDENIIRTPFRWYARIEKQFSDNHVVAGYASVPVIDKQNDLIPLTTLESAWDKFSANEDFMHTHILHSNIPVGKVLPSYTDPEGQEWKSEVRKEPGREGLFVVSQLRDDIQKGIETWDLIEKGEIRGYSIGGEALRKEKVCNGGCFDRIDEMEIHEISYVDKPANEPSVFKILKRDELVNDIMSKLPKVIITVMSEEDLEKEIIRKPFGDYKDMDDCIRQNKGKVGNSGAYCAAIHHQITGKWPAQKVLNTMLDRQLRERLMQDDVCLDKVTKGLNDKNFLEMYNILWLRKDLDFTSPVKSEDSVTEDLEKGDVAPDPLEQTSISEANETFKGENKMDNNKIRELLGALLEQFPEEQAAPSIPEPLVARYGEKADQIFELLGEDAMKLVEAPVVEQVKAEPIVEDKPVEKEAPTIDEAFITNLITQKIKEKYEGSPQVQKAVVPKEEETEKKPLGFAEKPLSDIHKTSWAEIHKMNE